MASEKAPLLESHTRPVAPVPQRRSSGEWLGSLRLVLVGVVGTIAISQLSTPSWFRTDSVADSLESPKAFGWADAVAKPHLDYHQCLSLIHI